MDKAKATLEKLSLGKNVTLSYGGRWMGCNGRLLTLLHLPDGAWLEGENAAQAKNSASGDTRFITFTNNPNWSRI